MGAFNPLSPEEQNQRRCGICHELVLGGEHETVEDCLDRVLSVNETLRGRIVELEATIKRDREAQIDLRAKLFEAEAKLRSAHNRVTAFLQAFNSKPGIN